MDAEELEWEVMSATLEQEVGEWEEVVWADKIRGSGHGRT